MDPRTEAAHRLPNENEVLPVFLVSLPFSYERFMSYFDSNDSRTSFS